MLLVGDGHFDYKDYMETGVANRVPPLMVKTAYLWTASDPTYASVNGDDSLPDMAIGRLPEDMAVEAQEMVEKIVAFESAGRSFFGKTVLVADNPDRAGDFQAAAEELISNVLAPHRQETNTIFLGQLGAPATRSEIVQAFDEGASLMSYLGHGGVNLWAHENIFDLAALESMQIQPQQPLVLTINCYNGFFHYPFKDHDSLAEELLKAKGKGAIAVFSPSGLSLVSAAHWFHKALLEELVNGRHRHLGDAILAAQAAYAWSGAFPELLSVFHLFGDPAMKLQ